MRFMIALAAMTLTACSPAPGDPIPATNDADRVFEVKCPQPGPTGSGTDYPSIYTELIGPKGVARCQDSSCHGGKSENGGLALGDGPAEAYKGMTNYGLIRVDAPDAGGDDAGGDASGEVSVAPPPANVDVFVNIVTLNPKTGKVKMPRELCGNRLLNATEVERIRAWGRAGGLP